MHKINNSKIIFSSFFSSSLKVNPNALHDICDSRLASARSSQMTIAEHCARFDARACMIMTSLTVPLFFYHFYILGTL